MKRSRSYRAFLDSEAVIRAGMAGDFPALHRAVAAFRARPHEMHWDILLFGEVLLDIATGNTGAARVRFDEAVGTHLVPSTSKTTARRASYLRSVLVLLGENPRLLGTAGTRMSEDPISLAFSAGRDIDHGDYDAASGKLSKAAAGARTPFQEHVVFTMLARLGIAGQDADSTRDSASHLLVLARTHKLKIAFALLADDERARILDSLGSPAELRAAFAATRPLTIDNAPTNTSMLTARQLDVIRALAEFGSRQEVAKKLFLSPGTVKAHLRAIYKKLDAHNQAEALYKAAALGLLQKR
jgi:DNA-binding CsgD family transcriptional regulator